MAMHTMSMLVLLLAMCVGGGVARLPEANMTVLERIIYNGYPSAREYSLYTDDCYMLTVQRIQQPRGVAFQNNTNKPVAFLQHGLTASSGSWVINLPGQSIAYVLADAGYDVWLGNIRGNEYGLKHCYLNSSKDAAFWNFTWSEMAKHDLPAMVEFALATSGQAKLTYIGHSQGTMIAFAHFSREPDWAMQHIERFIAYAPVATVRNITTDLQHLSKYTDKIEAFFNKVHFVSLGQLTWVLDIFKPICHDNSSAVLDACENLLFYFLGSAQRSAMNQTRIPLIIDGYPSGTSVKNIAHFGQLVQSGCFCEYDYGSKGNMVAYNQTTPPIYDLTKFPHTLPVHLVWSQIDELADPADIARTLIPNLPQATQQVLTDFSHCDFVWALSATEAIYAPTIAYMNGT